MSDEAGFLRFIKDYGEVILAFVAILLSVWFTTVSTKKEQLADPKHRDALLESRGSRWANAYQNGLARVTGWADHFYGPNPSFQALGRCLTLAFLYPIFAALLAWVLANVHSPGGFRIFADAPNIRDRMWPAGLVIAAGVILFLYFRHFDWLDGKFKDFATHVFPESPRRKALRSALRLGAFAVAFGFAVAFAVAIAGAFTGAFASAFAVAIAFAGAGAFAVAFAGAFAVLVFFIGETEAAVTPLFFFAALPLCNALTDFMSVCATRDFLRIAQRRERPLGFILLLVLIDLILGALCLLVLLVLLTQGFDLWGRLSPDTLPLDWRAYWTAAMTDPWQGIALWFMAFTTILPTLVHAVFGLSAVLTNGSRMRARALDQLAATSDNLSDADRTAIARKLAGATVYGVGLAIIVLAAFSWAIWVLTDAVLHWSAVEAFFAWLFPLTPQ